MFAFLPIQAGILHRQRRSPAQLGRLAGWVLRIAIVALPAQLAAQQPVLRPSPNLELYRPGSLSVLLPLADGSTVVSGAFMAINGVRGQVIAKMRADGSVDATWTPAIIGRISAMIQNPDGSIIVAGHVLPGIGTQIPPYGLARIASTGSGSIDPLWQMRVSGEVHALAVGASGDLYVGGRFTSIGGHARSRLAKVALAGNGQIDLGWNPAPDGEVSSLALDADGALFVGGSFLRIGGEVRRGLAKVNSSGSGDVDLQWQPLPNHIISDLVLDGSGSLIVSGHFVTIGGQPRIRLAKLATNGIGLVDASWRPTADWDPNGIDQHSYLTGLTTDAAGSVYVSGRFVRLGGRPGCCVAKLMAAGSGTADPAWQPPLDPSAFVGQIALDTQGTLFVAGQLRTTDAAPSISLARLRVADGTTRAPIVIGSPGRVEYMAAQSDGGMILAGEFVIADGHYRGNLLRLLPDGRVDELWNSALPTHYVRALVTDSLGDVYLGGHFESVAGIRRLHLAKLDGQGTGALVADWQPDPDQAVFALAVTHDGALIAGGNFQQIGGQPRRYLARLSTTGTGVVDPQWNPSPPALIQALVIDPAGRVYAGSNTQLVRYRGDGTGSQDGMWNPPGLGVVQRLVLDNAGGVIAARNWVWEFSRETTISRWRTDQGSGDGLPDWQFRTTGGTYALAVEAGGHLLAGGDFSWFSPDPSQYRAMIRLDATGSRVVSWNPDLNATVRALILDGAGGFRVGGDFFSAAGQSRFGVAAFGQGGGGVSSQSVPLGYPSMLLLALLLMLATWVAVRNGRRPDRGRSAQ